MNIDKLIVSLPQKNEASLTTMQANAERQVSLASSDVQRNQALQMLEEIAAERAKRHRAAAEAIDAERALTADSSSAERVERAFVAMPPTENEIRVIRALLANPGSTSTELSRYCDWKGQIWHTFFGGLCKLREVYLWPAEPSDTRDADFYSGILADLDRSKNRFTMKPDAVAGLRAAGIAVDRQ